MEAAIFTFEGSKVRIICSYLYKSKGIFDSVFSLSASVKTSFASVVKCIFTTEAPKGKHKGALRNGRILDKRIF